MIFFSLFPSRLKPSREDRFIQTGVRRKKKMAEMFFVFQLLVLKAGVFLKADSPPVWRLRAGGGVAAGGHAAFGAAPN